MNINTQERPLDRRCREAHPERIVVGDETFVRQDVLANRYGVSERTINRGDRAGAPYRFFGGVKYRPEERYDAFVLSSIETRKPQPPKRSRKGPAAKRAT
jgi:hypothetical protein